MTRVTKWATHLVLIGLYGFVYLLIHLHEQATRSSCFMLCGLGSVLFLIVLAFHVPLTTVALALGRRALGVFPVLGLHLFAWIAIPGTLVFLNRMAR
jgi:hypothetical protein